MALPALQALARLGPLDVHAPGWGRDLYRDVPATVRPRGAMAPADAAVLFPPSLRAALEALRVRERIGTATDHRGPLLTRIVAEGPHRFDTYRALAEALGARVSGPPRWAVRPEDESQRARGPRRAQPGERVGAGAEWPHFARAGGARPGRGLRGPGEEGRVAPLAAGPRCAWGCRCRRSRAPCSAARCS
ncbi:MAG: hypothetical protein R3F59_16380 [Myxococcota bacterium]